MSGPTKVLARRLRPGDRIAIVSPSGVVTPELTRQLDRGIRALEDMGFAPALSRHALSRTLGYSATPEEKAADLAEAFRDPSIAGIFCSQGGATANACLPLLDFEEIRRHPKVFLGISDITVLLNALHARSGLVTFHGDDVMWGLGREVHAFTREELRARLMAGAIGPIRPHGPTATVRPGVAEGPLLGGNLTAFLKLAATPYLPDVDGAVLFLEEYGFSPESVHCQVHQLAQMGVLDRIAGLVVGHIHDEEAATRTVRYEEVVRTVVGDRPIPILKTENFGHDCPNTVLPVGARVRLDADRGELAIVEPCLRDD